MNFLYGDIKVHFIGIGGIGMSALAKYLLLKGFTVTGSDVLQTEVTVKLQKQGAIIVADGSVDLVQNCDVVVYSSAIKNDNNELAFAKKMKKALYTRAELLNLILSTFNKSIGIAGSHGKTTVTSILAHIFKRANKSFTAFIGGIDNTFENFYSDKDAKLLLTEVCEYDYNINNVSPFVSVVLNVDNDHLDTYKNIENLKNTFFNYLDRGSVRVICIDDIYLSNYKGNAITYSINGLADYNAKNLHQKSGKYSFDCYNKDKFLFKVELNLYGINNVKNALCAIACAKYFNVKNEDIIKVLKTFKGVKRRFEEIGNKNSIKYIADYCHHPTEILSTLKTAKQMFKGDYAVVFQPHTYSRTKLLLNDFIKVFENESPIIFKTYPAREKYDKFGSAEYLVSKIKGAEYASDITRVFEILKTKNVSNALILGAGDLYDKIKNYIR